MRLYHISEDPDIRLFQPRPSPSYYSGLIEKVVFAVSDDFLYNYLLPRDCPRVSFYINKESSQYDINKFIGNCKAIAILYVPSEWKESIERVTLYCYDFPIDTFALFDTNAGYYISKEAIVLLSIRAITDISRELSISNVELRYTESLTALAEQVQESSLNYSLIRMRNL